MCLHGLYTSWYCALFLLEKVAAPLLLFFLIVLFSCCDFRTLTAFVFPLLLTSVLFFLSFCLSMRTSPEVYTAYSEKVCCLPTGKQRMMAKLTYLAETCTLLWRRQFYPWLCSLGLFTLAFGFLIHKKRRGTDLSTDGISLYGFKTSTKTAYFWHLFIRICFHKNLVLTWQEKYCFFFSQQNSGNILRWSILNISHDSPHSEMWNYVCLQTPLGGAY